MTGDIKQKKISKSDTIKVIELYFSLQGKRMTNLNKVTIEKLNEVIKKHNINVNEMLIKLNEEEEQFRIMAEKKEEELRLKREQINKEREEALNLKQEIWNKLSKKNKQKIKQLFYDKYVDETAKKNLKNKRDTDDMEKKFIRDGCKFVERENDFTLKVNGVIIVNGWNNEIMNKEDYFNEFIKCHIDTYDCGYKNSFKLINELYLKQQQQKERRIKNKVFVIENDEPIMY